LVAALVCSFNQLLSGVAGNHHPSGGLIDWLAQAIEAQEEPREPLTEAYIRDYAYQMIKTRRSV
jgi:hypothetical protein